MIQNRKDELYDHSTQRLDSFFPPEETEKSEAETISESVHPVGISLSDFISEVCDMVNSDDKTTVLDWIELASFMTDVDENGRRTLEGELQKLYREEILPLTENGLCGAIYTQVSDVEDETNGLFTYDREVLKVKPEEIKPILDEITAAYPGKGMTVQNANVHC